MVVLKDLDRRWPRKVPDLSLRLCWDGSPKISTQVVVGWFKTCQKYKPGGVDAQSGARRKIEHLRNHLPHDHYNPLYIYVRHGPFRLVIHLVSLVNPSDFPTQTGE